MFDELVLNLLQESLISGTIIRHYQEAPDSAEEMAAFKEAPQIPGTSHKQPEA